MVLILLKEKASANFEETRDGKAMKKTGGKRTALLTNCPVAQKKGGRGS